MDAYYVIVNKNDNIVIERLLKVELLRRLNEGHYGEEAKFLSVFSLLKIKDGKVTDE